MQLRRPPRPALRLRSASTTATVTGTRRSGRTGDDLVRPVRDVDRVRLADREGERGLRHRRRQHHFQSREPQGRLDVPLPRRRHERHGHGARQRRRVHDAHSAGRDDRRRHRHRHDLGDAERHRRPEQPRHHLLLRVRHLDELRHEDRGQERGLGCEPAERGGRDRRSSRSAGPTTSGSSRRATPGRRRAPTPRSRRARRPSP